MKLKFINTGIIGMMLAATSIVNVAHAGLFTLGDTLNGGIMDGWQSIMVINHNDEYTNTSGADQIVTLNDFNFTVGNYRGRVTPFVVKINQTMANDFTLMAIGDIRYSGTDYFSTGDVSLDFSTTLSQFTLGAGETIASGFLDADADGNSFGSVIPYINGDILSLSGSWNNSGSGSLSQGVGFAPTFGNSIFVNGLARDYSYNITTNINAIPEPSTFVIFALGLLGLASRRLSKKS